MRDIDVLKMLEQHYFNQLVVMRYLIRAHWYFMHDNPESWLMWDYLFRWVDAVDERNEHMQKFWPHLGRALALTDGRIYA